MIIVMSNSSPWFTKHSLLFTWGYVLAAVGTAVCAISFLVNVETLISGRQATPKSVDLTLPIGDEGSWNIFHDTTNPAFHELATGSNDWAAQKQKTLPPDWKVQGPFAGSDRVYDYPAVLKDQGAPFGFVTVPNKDVHGRWRLWVPTLLRELLYAVGLFLAARMLHLVKKRGPFDPRVYRYLRVIAVLGLIGNPLYSFVHMDMLNRAYGDLYPEMRQAGIFAWRYEPSFFNPAWLVVLAIVEILRHGSQIKQENDETV